MRRSESGRQYRIGLYGDPTADNDYHAHFFPGVDNAFSEGNGRCSGLLPRLRWGLLLSGKGDGCWAPACNTTVRTVPARNPLLLVAPFGPLDLGIGFYPYRFAGGSARPPTIFPPPLPILQIDPYDLNGRQYYNRSENSGSFSRRLSSGFVRYSQGPMQVGVLGTYGSFHIGPESRLRPQPLSWLRIPNYFTVPSLLSTTTEVFTSMLKLLGCIGPTRFSGQI